MTEGAVPADMADAATSGARSADRNGRRGRRNADGEILRGRHADPGRAGEGPASARRARQDLPAGLRVGPGQHRRAAADGRGARLPALAGRSPVHGARQRRDGDEAGRREGAVRRLRLEDGGRSVRRPHHDVPRLPGRAEGGLDRHQRHARHAGTARPPDRAAGQDAKRRCRRSRPATSAPSPS